MLESRLESLQKVEDLFIKYRTRTLKIRGLYFIYPFFTAAAAHDAEQPLFLDYLLKLKIRGL